MRFEQVTVVGVGLIGGSFALAVRQAGMATRITGWNGGASIDAARRSGVIDAVEESFAQGRRCEADLVYLAAPVGGIIEFLRTRGSQLKPGAIVTDAGSSKREICRAAKSLPPELAFIGGHPMAGSHNAGVEVATAELFHGAAYALVTNGLGEESGAVRAIEEIVRGIGGRPIFISAEEHDRAVARTSQAPQLVSTALALAIFGTGDDEVFELTGGGLKDMTRLAESRWSVWEDVCRTNSDEIAAALDESIAEMEAARKAISTGDFGGLRDIFRAANELVTRFHARRGENASSTTTR